MNVYPAGYFSPFNHTSFGSSILETAVHVVHVSAGPFQPWLRGSGAGLSCAVGFTLTLCHSLRAFTRFMVHLVIRMQGSSSGVLDVLLKRLWRKQMLNKHRAEQVESFNLQRWSPEQLEITVCDHQ